MNRIFLLLFGAVTYVAHAQVPGYVPAEGLVSWYSFDGNANDGSGNENHAVESANANLMPSFVYDSHWNREVIEFDDIDDELTVLAPNQLGVGNEFSFSTWLIPNEQNHGQVVSMDAGRFSFFLHGANDHFDALSSTSWASEAYYCGWNNHPYVHPDGWFHMTITISSDSIKAFGNGQFIAGMDCGGQSTFDTNIIFGYRNMYSSGDYHWGGRLADCGMWNRALSASEVLALYNAEPPGPGCTDPTACNFNEEATSDDGSCIPSGCMEPLACNYNALAECPGDTCDYTCCPGPGCCGPGMHWDYNAAQCAIDESCEDDLDGDGVIGVNDLMQLLSSFGTDCTPDEEPETAEFTCGDPVTYHGYDYATVQIGEQCWFAENLRNEYYSNGDAIPGDLSDLQWSSISEGAQAVYDNDNANLEDYGRLYNGYAVIDSRGVCPNDWHVPSDDEFIVLELELGLAQTETQELGWRGTDQGTQLKASPEDAPSWNGTNSSGFTSLPCGYREYGGAFHNFAYWGYHWTNTEYQNGILRRKLSSSYTEIDRYFNTPQYGFSIRCLKD